MRGVMDTAARLMGLFAQTVRWDMTAGLGTVGSGQWQAYGRRAQSGTRRPMDT